MGSGGEQKGEEHWKTVRENLRNLHESVSESLEGLKEAGCADSSKLRNVTWSRRKGWTCYVDMQSFAPVSPMIMWKIGNVPNALRDLAFSGNAEIATWLLLTAYDEMHKEWTVKYREAKIAGFENKMISYSQPL